MGRSLPEDLSPALVAQARENGSGEWAWRSPAILQVVAALAGRGYAILGGDVMYAEEGGTLDYYHGGLHCGDWHRDKTPEESWAGYVAASVAATQRYIETYVQRNGDAYWYVPVFTDEEGFARLPHQEA